MVTTDVGRGYGTGSHHGRNSPAWRLLGNLSSIIRAILTLRTNQNLRFHLSRSSKPFVCVSQRRYPPLTMNSAQPIRTRSSLPKPAKRQIIIVLDSDDEDYQPMPPIGRPDQPLGPPVRPTSFRPPPAKRPIAIVELSDSEEGDPLTFPVGHPARPLGPPVRPVTQLGSTATARGQVANDGLDPSTLPPPSRTALVGKFSAIS